MLDTGYTNINLGQKCTSVGKGIFLGTNFKH